MYHNQPRTTFSDLIETYLTHHLEKEFSGKSLTTDFFTNLEYFLAGKIKEIMGKSEMALTETAVKYLAIKYASLVNVNESICRPENGGKDIIKRIEKTELGMMRSLFYDTDFFDEIDQEFTSRN
jgi:hypothetical protein